MRRAQQEKGIEHTSSPGRGWPSKKAINQVIATRLLSETQPGNKQPVGDFSVSSSSETDPFSMSHFVEAEAIPLEVMVH